MFKKSESSISIQSDTKESESLSEIIDTNIQTLSDMQLKLFTQKDISSDDYNRISEKIGELKETMINCKSYSDK